MSRPTLAAIVTAHQDTPFGIMENLAAQTVQPAQVLVGISEFPLPWVVPSLPFPFTLVEFPTRADFGYSKRNELLEQVTTDYVGFFSHDDSYDGDYIEKMLDAVALTGAYAAFCQWDDGTFDREEFGRTCVFTTGSSTLGNFIVRTDVAKAIGGFPSSPRGEGLRDGALIEAIRTIASSIARVNVTLYHHNKPYWSVIRPTVWGVK